MESHGYAALSSLGLQAVDHNKKELLLNAVTEIRFLKPVDIILSSFLIVFAKNNYITVYSMLQPYIWYLSLWGKQAIGSWIFSYFTFYWIKNQSFDLRTAKRRLQFKLVWPEYIWIKMLNTMPTPQTQCRVKNMSFVVSSSC